STARLAAIFTCWRSSEYVPRGLIHRGESRALNIPILFVVFLGLYTAACTTAAREKGESRGTKPPCQFGQQPCTGPFGDRCYNLSIGEICNRGWVCSLRQGEQICLVTPQDSYCYRPSRGESCTHPSPAGSSSSSAPSSSSPEQLRECRAGCQRAAEIS